MINLESIRAFVLVAELGSFQKAAETLNVSAPALTRRVQGLESTLGVRLLERTTRNVHVTSVGREFLPKARKMLSDLDASLSSIKEFSNKRAGRVIVACIPTAVHYFLPAALKQFNKEFPNIRVRIIDEHASAVVERVRQQEADFGITFVGARDADLEYVDIVEDHYVVVCRHDHPLATQNEVEWRQLSQYRFVTANRLSGNRFVLDQALQKSIGNLDGFYEVQHLPASLGLVEAGLAVAALPHLAFPTKTHPTLTSRPLIEPNVGRTISLIRRRGAPSSLATEAFFDILSKSKQFGGDAR